MHYDNKMPKRVKRNTVYVVLSKGDTVEVFTSAQQAASCVPIHRNTLRKYTDSGKPFNKLGFLIVKCEINRIKGRGKFRA